MITADNYFNKLSVFTDKLTGPVKEAHDLATSLKNDGIDPFTTGDADIDETMQLLLNEVNKITNENNTETKASTPTPKVFSTKPRSNKNRAAKATPKAAKSPARRKKQSVVRQANDSKSISKPRANNTKAKRSNKASKKLKSKSQKPKACTPTKAPVTIKKLSKELQTIKQFAGMHGKKYSLKAIENKYNSAVNFAKQAIDHKAVVKTISEKLGKLLDVVKKANATDANVSIESEFLTKCKELVSGATVRVRTEFLSGIPNDPGYITRKSDGKYYNAVTEAFQTTLTNDCLIDWHKATKIANRRLSPKDDDTYTVSEYNHKPSSKSLKGSKLPDNSGFFKAKVGAPKKAQRNR